MARRIRHDADKPIRIELEDLPKDKPIFICACGLSKNFPFCDGSHKGCKDEVPGEVHVYDPSRTRVVRKEKDTDSQSEAR